MKELYNEYFHIPKHGKIRDKVMLVRTAITAIIMIVCLAAMSITAYAYFSYNVTFGSNIIKAASFEAQITISGEATDIPLTKEGQYHIADLKAGTTYSVTLTAPTNEGAAETGFCVITADRCTNTYHTQQLGVDKSVAGGKTLSITFTLTVSNDTTVKILSHWGTSSCYRYENLDGNLLYIKDKDEVKITVVASNTTSESDEEKETTSNETTATETTPTEVVHIVEANETLSAIEAHYGVSVDRIAAYNKLADPNNIYEGQKLVIPPANWEIPADATEQTTTTTTPKTTTPETTTTQTTASAETTISRETTVTDSAETTSAETETGSEDAEASE